MKMWGLEERLELGVRRWEIGDRSGKLGEGEISGCGWVGGAVRSDEIAGSVTGVPQFKKPNYGK